MIFSHSCVGCRRVRIVSNLGKAMDQTSRGLVPIMHILGVDSKTAVGTSPPGTKAGGNGNKEAQKVLCLLGGRTAEGKSARVRVQLEIERIIKAL